MAFSNRIRLPFQVLRPQFPEDKSIYRRSDGVTKTLSVVVRKTYAGETDFMPEKLHQRLAIALAHDNVTIEADKYLGGVSKDGDYEIDWPDFLDYPTAKASFSINVTPFDNTNSNCMSCEMAAQLALVDDTYPGILEEDTIYTMSASDNDSICCFPAVFSIVSYNSDYLGGASIDANGNVTVHTKPGGYASAVGIKLATYRVTCPNGSFDEADVFGDLNGDEPICAQPSDIVFSSLTSSGVNVSFTAAPGPPNHYLWRLYKASAPGVIVQQGTTAGAFSIAGLDASTEYVLYIRSQCDDTDDDDTASSFIQQDFTTANATTLCGAYNLCYDDFSPFPQLRAFFEYLDCNGMTQNIFIPNHQCRQVCALQTGPGSPTHISAGIPSKSSIIYLGTSC